MQEGLLGRVARGRGEVSRLESDSIAREELLRVVAESRSRRAKSADRGRSGSRASGSLAADARAEWARVEIAAESGAANGRDSTSGLAGRREPVRGLARDRADRLEPSQDLATDAKAARNALENGLDSTSDQADRREPVRALARDRAGRLERSRDLAADAKAALGEWESGAESGRNGNRADKILARSLASDRLADLGMRPGNRSVLQALSCDLRARSNEAIDRTGLTADEVRGRARARASAGAQEARSAGCPGRDAHGMMKETRRPALGKDLLLHSVANAARDSAVAKERSGRSLHSARGPAVSRGQASREVLQGRVDRGRADSRSRAGRAAEIEAARDWAASGLAGDKSQSSTKL